MNDFNYACTRCPRTFKLQEFYEKHKKVHELKKQHVCDICGFVYGAAKVRHLNHSIVSGC